MTNQERDVQRKLKVLRHAEQTGNIAKTCRYFGIGRASFYRWKTEYQQRGEAYIKAHCPKVASAVQPTNFFSISSKALRISTKISLSALF
jgi:transposase-like protein